MLKNLVPETWWLDLKREDYQNCSLLYCLPQLYAVISSHIWAVLTGVLGPACLGLGFLCVCFLLRASLCILFFLVYFLLFVLSWQYQCKWLPGKTRLWNDLLCVESDVKLCSLIRQKLARVSWACHDLLHKFFLRIGPMLWPQHWVSVLLQASSPYTHDTRFLAPFSATSVRQLWHQIRLVPDSGAD